MLSDRERIEYAEADALATAAANKRHPPLQLSPEHGGIFAAGATFMLLELYAALAETMPEGRAYVLLAIAVFAGLAAYGAAALRRRAWYREWNATHEILRQERVRRHDF
jgi:hypothetical protein